MRIHIFSAALVLALSACSQQAPEAPMPTTAPVSSSEVAVAAPADITSFKGENSLMNGNAQSVPTCSTPAILSITWDVTGKAETESVKLYAGDGTNAKLFASGGAQGSGETGQWVTPGGLFVLRNGRDEAELDRMTIPGPACP